MAMIPDHVREQIRAANDIVEVIGAYVPLRRSGTNYVALCPFHKEKTPSFHVSPGRQAFHCFGCHKGGDVFRFLQEHEGLTYVEAARRLAERSGIRIEFDESPGQRDAQRLRDRLLDLHEQITQRWQQALGNDAAGEPAREYLAQRGVTAESIRLFRLGYAPDAWDDTLRWARSRNWDTPLLEQGGLVLPRDPNDPSRGHYDRFRGRLVFPIADEQGRIIGFSARTLKPEEKTAKYINSPETPIFSKSRVLYGLDKSKRAILDAGSVILCEGQLDLIACFAAGVRHVVAPQGTALTGEHLRVLRRYAKEIILCFDSDAAGQKAIARALDELLASGLTLRVIAIPAPHDPDSYIKAHGPEAFRQLAANARDFFEFYLDHLTTRHDVRTDRGRLGLLEAMATALRKAGNEVLLDRYAQRTAMVLAASGGVPLSPDAVRAEFHRRLRRPERPAPTPREPDPDPDASSRSEPDADPRQGIPDEEFLLLKMALTMDVVVGWLGLHVDPEWILHPQVRRIFAALIESHASGNWAGAHAFLDGLDDEPCRRLGIVALVRPLSENLDGTRFARKDITFDPDRHPQDLALSLRNRWIDREIARLTLTVARPDLDDSNRLAGMQRLQELRRSRREPLVARI
ncbi:MAG: DNA primase [Verrucomicrobiae bacterium]|nr:DNA primase [Verrucomicrobiae bacterium]